MAVIGKPHRLRRALLGLFALCACGDPLAEKGFLGTPKFLGAGVMSSLARPVREGEPLTLSLAWAHRGPAAAGSSPPLVRPLRQPLSIVGTDFPAAFSFSVVQDELVPDRRRCPTVVSTRLAALGTDARAPLRRDLRFAAMHAFFEPGAQLARLAASWSKLAVLPTILPLPHDEDSFAALLSCYLDMVSVGEPKAEGTWPVCFDVADILLEGDSLPNQRQLPIPQLPGGASRYYQNLLATAGELVMLAAAPGLRDALDTPACAVGITNPEAIRGPYHLARVRCSPGDPAAFAFEIVDEATTKVVFSSDVGTMTGATPCERDSVFDLQMIEPSGTPAALLPPAVTLRTIIQTTLTEARAVRPDALMTRISVRGMDANGIIRFDPLEDVLRGAESLLTSWAGNRTISVNYSSVYALTGKPLIYSQYTGVRTELLPAPQNVLTDERLALLPDGDAIAKSLVESGCAVTGAEIEQLLVVVVAGKVFLGFARSGVGVHRLALLEGPQLTWDRLEPPCPPP